MTTMLARTWNAQDDPAVIVAKGTELLREIEEFRASRTWTAIKAHAESQIANALHNFERGEGENDGALRGEIRAYRSVLRQPEQARASVQRDIDMNRGKQET